ncbi:MAG: 4-hydroxythreonine-4-phosphate dehydrogenase [Nitrospinaceae bacterium]|nr:MAG: 4-hydroxythreonine-4-phosphate dehydrogenase [Nitrospinaceae bacterium]
MGDPAGVGPEIIIKAFQDKELFSLSQGIVIGDAGFLESTARQIEIPLTVHRISSPDQAQFHPGTLDVLDLKNVPGDLKRGRATAKGGKASVEYILRAVKLALDHQIDGITTAPINKESIHKAGFCYPGHTELLAEATNSKNVALMLAGKNLRVVLTTTHVPLHEVASQITAERVLTTIRLTHQWLKQHVAGDPKIAVTGLNPHCGDGGIFGKEETTAILPAMASARKQGIQVDGPHSADSLFIHNRHAAYDAVIAMYHDQGMIPVKMDSAGTAVNITLGLPILRTSVDHGTAYDIAGTGSASPESLKIALKAAVAFSKPTAVTN